MGPFLCLLDPGSLGRHPGKARSLHLASCVEVVVLDIAILLWIGCVEEGPQPASATSAGEGW